MVGPISTRLFTLLFLNAYLNDDPLLGFVDILVVVL